MNSNPLARFAALLLLAPLLAGCLSQEDMHGDCWTGRDPAQDGSPVIEPTPIDHSANPRAGYAGMGFDGSHWPDLHGAEITVLDHGAFDFAFESEGAAKDLFEELTNGTVRHFGADDAGTALELAAQDQQQGGGSFDVIYGIDNALMSRAVDADIFAPYTPLLAADVAPEFRFVPTIGGAWAATPVDMGIIGINVDARAAPVDGFGDLVPRADEFVTQDPRFSSPGLGFLISTVATFGEDCYLGYWEDLFDNGVTVTSGWTEAYVDRFSGGYGQFEEGTRGDKAIVTSYTSSPAYEMYYGYERENQALTAPQSTFQQVQTMGILKGSEQRAAAEAWIEFTLTPAFQKLAPEYNAIYPVVQTPETDAAVAEVYGTHDPVPGSFTPATLSSEEIGARVEGWVTDWVDLYDAKRA